jgi:hypothetical protein
MHKVGLEPTNHKGLALEANGFDRFPTYAKCKGRTETRTQIAGTKIRSDDHYTIRPLNVCFGRTES